MTKLNSWGLSLEPKFLLDQWGEVRQQYGTRQSFKLIARQLKASYSWSSRLPAPNVECDRVLSELRDQGIATSTVTRLGIQQSLFRSLQEEGFRLAADPVALERGV